MHRPGSEAGSHKNTEGGVPMYQFAQYGQTRVSKDGIRWTNWLGRQSYKYHSVDRSRFTTGHPYGLLATSTSSPYRQAR